MQPDSSRQSLCVKFSRGSEVDSFPKGGGTRRRSESTRLRPHCHWLARLWTCKSHNLCTDAIRWGTYSSRSNILLMVQETWFTSLFLLSLTIESSWIMRNNSIIKYLCALRHKDISLPYETAFMNAIIRSAALQNLDVDWNLPCVSSSQPVFMYRADLLYISFMKSAMNQCNLASFFSISNILTENYTQRLQSLTLQRNTCHHKIFQC